MADCLWRLGGTLSHELVGVIDGASSRQVVTTGFSMTKACPSSPQDLTSHNVSRPLALFSHRVTATMTANSTPKLIILLAGATIQDSTSDQRDKQHIFDLHRWLY